MGALVAFAVRDALVDLSAMLDISISSFTPAVDFKPIPCGERVPLGNLFPFGEIVFLKCAFLALFAIGFFPQVYVSSLTLEILER